jgi:hypothetical protein
LQTRTPGTGGSATLTVNAGAPPAITLITSPKPNGTYGAGTQILITVDFNQTVVVSGTPTLKLNSGGTASYVMGTNTTELTFSYTVGAGDTTNGTALDAFSTSALSGTITDQASNPANLTVPTGLTQGSLPFDKFIVIDAIAPTVVSYSVVLSGPNSLTYSLTGSARTRLPWQIAGIQVIFSKPIASADVNSISGVAASNLTGLGTSTLTWTLSAPISLASVTTTLSGTGTHAITDGTGNALANGGFTQAFKVLWADVNDDGVVTSADGVVVNIASHTGYNIFCDLNGDGVVDITDVRIVGTRNGTSLP